MKPKTNITCGVVLLGLASFAMAGDKNAPVELAPPPVSCPWTLEAALLYLEGDSEDSSGYEDQDYEYGYRLSLAYQKEGSLGYRLRYFDWEGTDDGNSSEEGPEVQSIDLELFKDISLGVLHGEVSLGARYFEIYEPYSGGADVDYAGWGPVLGVDLMWDLSDAWSIYLNARASYLFGDDDEDSASDDAPVLEAGLGIQRDLNFGNCGGYLRLGVETHQWFELAYDETDGEALGGVLAVGFNF